MTRRGSGECGSCATTGNTTVARRLSTTRTPRAARPSTPDTTPSGRAGLLRVRLCVRPASHSCVRPRSPRPAVLSGGFARHHGSLHGRGGAHMHERKQFGQPIGRLPAHAGQSRGKMLARDRGDLLVDPAPRSSSCRRLPPMASIGGDVHSASVVTGVGRIWAVNVSSSPTTPPSRAAPTDPRPRRTSARAGHRAAEQSARASTWSIPAASFPPMQDEYLSGRSAQKARYYSSVDSGRLDDFAPSYAYQHR